MDFSIITWDKVGFMAQCAGLSLLVAVIALIFGVILGTIGAAAKISKNKFFNAVGNVYVEFFRGTPMLLQIFFAYLGMPAIISAVTGSPIRFDPIITGAVAMSLNSGAYTTELIRSGIIGVDKGQWEAADTLGLSYIQKMRRIILPQAFKRIVPPLVSEFITLIKDTSLLSAIGVVELMKSAQNIGANYYSYVPPLLVASVMYLIMTLTISYFAKRLERRLAESD